MNSAQMTIDNCGFAYGTACPAYKPASLSSPPAEVPPAQSAPRAPQRHVLLPAFLRGHFNLTATGDTFLDTRNLGKGVAWINGHNLGRFWSGGPQNTLYVPGAWLKTGSNEIVVFDMLPTPRESVAGLDHPILDGPVRDKSTREQQ
jgi:hypothetical protein